VKPILEVHHLAKKYKIRHQSGGYLSLRERMLNAFKPGNTNSEDFWAVNDVSFEVQPGESVGIIGRNGAGKSTLLKILSKITPPTKGKIITRGRIASLLEVGTGFHPELTGRENIFFNGSLLGMKRKEIEEKFDEIVDFSGVEKFLDTPLKHYSSGMQLRLAFSVAAFLEPEILIIDEVLAVGDAEFQKKCLGKMENVSKNGRTILLSVITCKRFPSFAKPGFT
jgi:lipopolysaccharide transport system ATP-binding protein